jgi:hypothetical protein
MYTLCDVTLLLRPPDVDTLWHDTVLCKPADIHTNLRSTLPSAQLIYLEKYSLHNSVQLTTGVGLITALY